MDIMKALDEEFPDAPRMVLDTPEFEDALAMNDDLTAAGFAFAYGNRNGTLSDEEKEERRVKFMSELDRLDGALLSGGPFRLGDTFTGVDAIIAPTLERWRYQLPITADVDILDGRAGIAKWFEAMESFGPYADRAMGDEYSWTATNSMFLRFFGGGEDRPEVADAIKRADESAERLTAAFSDDLAGVTDEVGGRFAREAAAKLISNHEAVVRDCTRSDPASQKHLPRVTDAERSANVVLRHVVAVLLSSSGQGASNNGVLSLTEAASTWPVQVLPTDEDRVAAAAAARVVASRLCVPRDMSAPAAKILRGVLSVAADQLEGSVSPASSKGDMN